jgi:transposase
MQPSKGLSGKLLPIHFQPKEDELLSSWICRLALAHGVNSSSFCSQVLPRRHPTQQFRMNEIDYCVSSSILTALAKRTGTPVDRVSATTLPAYEGFLLERWSNHIGRQWTLPVKTLRRKTRHGLQYCPLCLATGEPYYRRVWRLVPITICTKHRVQLLDRCPKCSSPISFQKATYNGVHFPPSDRVTFCYSCQSDLRKFRVKAADPVCDEEVSFQGRIETALREGWIEIPGIWSGYSLLFFPVLHRLLRLLVGRWPRLDFYKSLDRRHRIKLPDTMLIEKRCELTRLSVGVRRELMNIVRRLFINWPDDLIDFCAAHRILSYDLSWRHSPVPFWFWTVINERMRHSLYRPPREEIESTISCLKKIRRRYRRWPRPYPEEMKAISDFLNASSPLKRKIRKTSGVSVIRRGDKRMQPQPVSATLWKKIEFIISSRSGQLKIESGVRRKLLDGILYVLYTGCSWEAMPAKFGAYKSARSMYYHWRRNGLLEPVWKLCSDFREE